MMGNTKVGVAGSQLFPAMESSDIPMQQIGGGAQVGGGDDTMMQQLSGWNVFQVNICGKDLSARNAQNLIMGMGAMLLVVLCVSIFGGGGAVPPPTNMMASGVMGPHVACIGYAKPLYLAQAADAATFIFAFNKQIGRVVGVPPSDVVVTSLSTGMAAQGVIVGFEIATNKVLAPTIVVKLKTLPAQVDMIMSVGAAITHNAVPLTQDSPCNVLNCGDQGKCSAARCLCSGSFTGKLCSIAPNPCLVTRCGPHGNCNIVGVGAAATAVCTCTQGYSGTTCSTPPNQCQFIKCKNGGGCAQGRCICPGGFLGKSCQVKDPCFSVKCGIHGVCITPGLCLCNRGWTGANCDTAPAVACNLQCGNYGKCAVQGSTPICACLGGYTGPLCKTKPSWSGTNCGTNGKVVTDANGQSGGCSCMNGYTGNLCQIKPPYSQVGSGGACKFTDAPTRPGGSSGGTTPDYFKYLYASSTTLGYSKFTQQACADACSSCKNDPSCGKLCYGYTYYQTTYSSGTKYCYLHGVRPKASLGAGKPTYIKNAVCMMRGAMGCSIYGTRNSRCSPKNLDICSFPGLTVGATAATPGATSGVIQEGSSYSSYSGNLHCSATIKAPPGYVVKLRFTQFHTEGAGCKDADANSTGYHYNNAKCPNNAGKTRCYMSTYSGYKSNPPVGCKALSTSRNVFYDSVKSKVACDVGPYQSTTEQLVRDKLCPVTCGRCNDIDKNIYDGLYVYDGNSKQSADYTLFGDKSRSLPTLYSSAQNMEVLFVTDATGNSAGWSAKWSFVQKATCGDGVKQAQEACDDGNSRSGDGCSDNCRHVEAGYKCPRAGRKCQDASDECARSPCLNNGKCIDGPNMFKCQCRYGFAGSTCEINRAKYTRVGGRNAGTCKFASSRSAGGSSTNYIKYYYFPGYGAASTPRKVAWAAFNENGCINLCNKCAATAGCGKVCTGFTYYQYTGKTGSKYCRLYGTPYPPMKAWPIKQFKYLLPTTQTCMRRTLDCSAYAHGCDTANLNVCKFSGITVAGRYSGKISDGSGGHKVKGGQFCTVTIAVPKGKVVRLKFTQFSLEGTKCKDQPAKATGFHYTNKACPKRGVRCSVSNSPYYNKYKPAPCRVLKSYCSRTTGSYAAVPNSICSLTCRKCGGRLGKKVYDGVYIYNGVDTSGAAASTLAGDRSRNLPYIVSTGNIMTLVFKTDASGQSAGWAANWAQANRKPGGPPPPAGRVTLYYIKGAICGQVTMPKSYMPFATKYAKAKRLRLQTGTCGSKGYTLRRGVRTLTGTKAPSRLRVFLYGKRAVRPPSTKGQGTTVVPASRLYRNARGSNHGLYARYFNFLQGKRIPNCGRSGTTCFSTNTKGKRVAHKPSLLRYDKNINFASSSNPWGKFGKFGKDFKDHYAVTWNGYLKVTGQGTYYFSTISDDGSKLYLNRRLVVNNDGLHGMQIRSGKVNLRAGMQKLYATFFEAGGGAGMILKYTGTDTKKKPPPLKLSGQCHVGTVVPAAMLYRDRRMRTRGLTGTFYDCAKATKGRKLGSRLPSRACTGKADKLMIVKLINYKSSTGSWPGLGAAFKDSFYATFTGYLKAPSAMKATMATSSDDGSTLMVNGKLIVNNDGLHGMVQRCGTCKLRKGANSIRIRFFESGGGAGLIWLWKGVKVVKPPPPPPVNKVPKGIKAIPASALYQDKSLSTPGLMAYYFSFKQGSKLPRCSVHSVDAQVCNPGNHKVTKKRVDRTVNFKATSAAWKGLPKTFADSFTVVWTGFLKVPATNTYIFCTTSDDGSNLFVQGRAAVNNDGLHGMQTRCNRGLRLRKGAVRLRAQMFESGGGAGMILSWYASPVLHVIPARVLSHSTIGVSTPGLLGQYYDFHQTGAEPKLGQTAKMPLGKRTPLVVRSDMQVNFGSSSRPWGKELNLKAKNFQDHFAVKWTGLIKVTTAGRYQFATSSDDGSWLYIDGRKVVSNGGLHGMKQVATPRNRSPYLKVGMHKITLIFSESSGGAGCVLKWAGPL